MEPAKENELGKALWMDYQQYLAEKEWMEKREGIFIRMCLAGIPPWEFHRHIKEFEDNEEDSPD